MTAIPVIETDRLILRGPQLGDRDGYIAFLMSERARYVGGPKSEVDADIAFHAEFGFWALHGHGNWAVEERATGACVGYVGVWHPRGFPERELGWLLWPEGEGRGIGFEAASAALGHVFGVLGWETVVSYIDPANARSIRLAERLGAVRDPDVLAADPADLVYRHAPGGRVTR